MKAIVCGVVAVLFGFAGGVFAADEADVTDQMVIDLVAQTAAAVEKDAPGTFAKINAGEAPYVNKDIPAFYVFVYDLEVNMIAHPKAELVGKSMKGKPDPKGKKFRDLIVEGAKKDGTGWVEYMYQKPGDKGLFEKKSYFKVVKGSDGKEYVVISGNYAKK